MPEWQAGATFRPVVRGHLAGGSFDIHHAEEEPQDISISQYPSGSNDSKENARIELASN